MNSILLPALGFFLIVTSTACRSPRASRPTVDPKLEVRRADMGGVTRCYVVDRIYVCSIPDESDLELAQRRGVELVIDLREEIPTGPDAFDVERGLRDLGLPYEWIPLPDGGISNASVDRAIELLAAEDRGQVLMFSDTGARGAMLLAIYRSSVLGVSRLEALEDARRFGMKPGASEQQVRQQMIRLANWCTP